MGLTIILICAIVILICSVGLIEINKIETRETKFKNEIVILELNNQRLNIINKSLESKIDDIESYNALINSLNELIILNRDIQLEVAKSKALNLKMDREMEIYLHKFEHDLYKTLTK